jgi:hypothetical protein
VQPPNFDQDLASDWGLWVMENGLPKLPLQVDPGEAVPISWSAGPTFGAVVFVTRYEPDMVSERDPHVDEDVHCYHRTHDGWEELGPNGGTDWPPGADLCPVDVAPRYANLNESLSVRDGAGICTALSGLVGREAKWFQVTDPDRTYRLPINAPLHVAVVCVAAAQDTIIRILDQDGALLGTPAVARSFEE